MALSYAAPARSNPGGRWVTNTTITLDTEYPVGGYTLDAKQLGLPAGSLFFALAKPAINAEGKNAFNTNVNSEGKLQLYAPAKEKENEAELASKTDVHLFTVQVIAYGV